MNYAKSVYNTTAKKSCNCTFVFTAAVPYQRHFPSDVLEIGAPNLLVTAPGVCMCVCVRMQECPTVVNLHSNGTQKYTNAGQVLQ